MFSAASTWHGAYARPILYGRPLAQTAGKQANVPYLHVRTLNAFVAQCAKP